MCPNMGSSVRFALALYYGALSIAGVTAGPVLLLKKKTRAGLSQKLGAVPHELRTNRAEQGPLWFHAVSVGEFNAVWPLIRAIHDEYPLQSILITTTTATGQALAKERAGEFAKIGYFPFDLPWIAGAWLDEVKPAAVLIAETEVWPGFYSQCNDRSIPVIILNGRLSPRSHRRYTKMRALFGPTFASASLIVTQSEAEASRYRELAGADAPIVVAGNLKYDGLSAISTAERDQLRTKFGIESDSLIIVGGSTHEGEESALLQVFKDLQKAAPSARLILVPRHPERFDRVEETIRQFGFNCRRYTKDERIESQKDVFLLDTIGQLNRFYSLASVAFVGGTLVKIGGHNLVEPCTYSVPVVCGPHVFKTRDAAQALVSEGALMIAADAGELQSKISTLLQDKGARERAGTAGRRYLDRSQGALARTMDALRARLLDKTPDHRQARARSSADKSGSCCAAKHKAPNSNEAGESTMTKPVSRGGQ